MYKVWLGASQQQPDLTDAAVKAELPPAEVQPLAPTLAQPQATSLPEQTVNGAQASFAQEVSGVLIGGAR